MEGALQNGNVFMQRLEGRINSTVVCGHGLESVSGSNCFEASLISLPSYLDSDSEEGKEVYIRASYSQISGVGPLSVIVISK